MSGQPGTHLGQFREFTCIDLSQLGQAGVHGVHTVPLAEDEMVLRSFLPFHVQEVEEQGRHHLRNGHGAPKMYELSVRGHGQQVAAQGRRTPFQGLA